MTRKVFATIRVQVAFFEASDGSEGLDFVFGRGKYRDREAYPLPDLILLDFDMPGIDGLEVLAALRCNEATRHLPVVMTTTSENEQDVRRCYKLGANACVAKPLSSEELWKALGPLNLPWFPTSEASATQD